MIFEKQQYQQDCVDNIVSALNTVDFDNQDFSGLQGQLKTLNYNQFSIKNEARIDVLMETGTGKTFAYLQTIFELNKQFNQTKFIIVLPRTAIKLGVIQQIKLTAEYFYNSYKKHLNYIDYPKHSLATVQQNFIDSNDLSILITTNSAFNSDKNNINKTAEGLFRFGSTWDGIAKQNPIVIIDEPHLLKGSETKKGLDKLKNAFFIRFGATYPTDKKDKKHHLSNVVYALDSISAFNQYLVKQIGVSTIFANSELSALSVHNIHAKISFKASYHINTQLHQATIRKNDDIGAKTGLAQYQGISVVKINKDKIFLSNKTILQSSTSYALNDDEIRQMIAQTIELHFAKEEALFAKGIKALSLFFIPNIIDFRGDNPRIKNIFEQQYRPIRDKVYQTTDNPAYKKYLDKDYQNDKLQVHEGYFSGDKGNADKKESDGVNTILNEKEKLLSFSTPLRFIFSVWALQEGWDNPNVFTICKLSNTNKDISSRQQVGRGLRIAVNQQGRRLTYAHLGEKASAFYNVNVLDIVVSGKEQEFINSIQQEIINASWTVVGDTITLEILKQKQLSDTEAVAIFSGLLNNKIIDNNGKIQSPILDFLNNHRDTFALIDNQRFDFIKQIFSNNHQNIVKDNNKKPKLVKIRKTNWKHFKNLWEAINKKSNIVYKNINQQNLIELIATAFNQEPISPIKIKITQQKYNTQNNNIEYISEHIIGDQDYFKRQNLSQFITKFAKDENLPLVFVSQLFSQLDGQQFYNNPKVAQNLLKTLIKDNIHSTIIQNIGYEFNQTNIYANELQDKTGKLISEISSTKLAKFTSDDQPAETFLYDKLVWDSLIEKDAILTDPSKIGDNQITVFAKLPKINIPTPYKTYNPDFAYLIKKPSGKQLFLVVETKGYKFAGKIPTDEQKKIDYGKKFFNALQKELPNVEIKYKTRINGQSLSDILEDK